MKRSSLLAFKSLISIAGDHKKTLNIAFLAMLLCFTGFKGFSTVVVTPAPNGSSICSTVATSPTNVGTITITESVNNDFPSGASQIVLAPPPGWSFVAVLPTVNAVGGDVSIGIMSITAGLFTINFNSPTITHIDAITISNLQVTAATVGSSPGNIFAQSDLGVVGIATGAAGTNFGSLAITTAVVPAVSISGVPAGTICAGTGVVFTPTPTNGGASPTYQWFVNGSSVGTSPFYASSSLANGNTVNCIMTPTAGGCSSPATATSNTITMSVNPQPTAVTVSGGGTFCGSTTITAANGGSGTIYFQGTTAGGTSTTTPSASQVISASGTYYFRAQSGAGCWGPDGSVTVIINALPSTVTVTGGGNFCGGTTTLNASNLGDGTIYYQGITSNGVSVATPSSSQVIAASGTYYFRAQSGAGCWSVQGSAVVNINPIPTAVTASGAGTFCGSTTITAANGGSGTIYFQGTTSGGTSTLTPSASQVVTTSGTYYFRAQTGAGCWGAEGSVTVTINPAATANAGLPQSICAGSTITLAGAIGGSAASSTWSAPSGAFSNVSSLTSTYTPSIGSGVVTLTLTTNDPDGAGPCTSGTSTVNITVSAQPTIVTVSGGGAFCGSATITAANGGSGIIYYQSTTSNGTSVATPSVSQVITTSGTYYFRAQSGGGCWGPQGSAVVTINPLPNPYTVTGGGGYCTGSTGSDIGLSGSDAGVNYQLYRGALAVGAAVAGTNAPLDFGLQTIAGTYTVIATNPATGCTLFMGGSAIVSINALPTAFTISGTGSYCSGGAGITINQSGSAAGVSYQLFVAGLPVGSAVAGTGGAITFGPQTTGGIYSCVATNTTTGCTNNMLGSPVITINPLPLAFSVTGGGNYCTGGTGVIVGLSGSSVGVSYQLYRGALPIGAPLAGTGAALSFGLQTTAATYTIVATNTITFCQSTMTGSAIITSSPLPGTFAVTGGGSFCSGGTGVHVGLAGSAIGINYQLYLGGIAVGSAMAGTGAALDFGLQTAVGTYTVVATNATTLCTSNMTGNAIISTNAIPTAFSVTGGGSYCTGGAGTVVGLSGSQLGVTYQLYISFVPTGAPMAGTGAALSWGSKTAAGFYTVIATNTTTTCTNNMTGGVAITILPLPTQYNVTGGGGFCTGGTGVNVGLSNSDIGTNYQLYQGITPVGVPVAGTGGALNFGLQTTPGTYTVVGTSTSTTCVNNMSGSVVVSINPLPGLFNVTGGGAYCAGGTGVAVGLSGSAIGIDYQLMVGGTFVGSALPGTGGSLDFGLQTSTGTYTVVAINTATTCTNTMTGSAIITINPLPTAYSVAGGGSYCAGGAGFDVTLSNSDLGVDYALYNGGTLINTLSGTGALLDYGFQTGAGTYTVVAVNLTTFCVNNMTGSAVINIIPLPTVYTISGGGSYCAGSAGVDISMSGSEIGVDYQLMVGGLPVGGLVSGTGAVLDFGNQTTAGTYSCIATTATGGCTSTMTGTPSIVVNPAPVVFTLSAGGAYCAGGAGIDITLSGSTTLVNYQLFNGASPVGLPVAGTGGVLDFGFTTAAGTYTVVATDPAVTCTSNMAGSSIITVSAYPVVSAISGVGIMCQGATITLTDATPGGVWTSATPAIAGVSLAGVVTGTASGTATINYTVTNGTGCVTSVSATVNVLASPAVAAISGATNVCLGLTTTFSDATTGGTWSSSNSAIASVSGTGVVTGVATGAATISYTVTNLAGCSTSATYPVTVGGSMPVSALLPVGSATICHGTPVDLSVVTTGGGGGLTYTWYKNGIVIPGATTAFYTADSSGLYTATISNGTCSETFSGTTVLAPPVPIITLDTIPNLLFTGSFTGYQWYLNGVAIPGATSNNTLMSAPDGSVYTVVVSDANGCTDTSAIWVVGGVPSLHTQPVSISSEIKIYPNPATTILHIDAPVKVLVSVISIDGTVLIDHKEAITLNVDQLSNGMYLIMVYDENKNLLKTEKFTKIQ